jgi:hypothetical protein
MGDGARSDYFGPLKKIMRVLRDVCGVDVAADTFNEEENNVYKK